MEGGLIHFKELAHTVGGLANVEFIERASKLEIKAGFLYYIPGA